MDYKEYLDKARLKQLAELQERYNQVYAKERAEAASSLIAGHRQFLRGLQNVGLAGRKGNLISGREKTAALEARRRYREYNAGLSRAANTFTTAAGQRMARQAIDDENRVKRAEAYAKWGDEYAAAKAEAEKEYAAKLEEAKQEHLQYAQEYQNSYNAYLAQQAQYQAWLQQQAAQQSAQQELIDPRFQGNNMQQAKQDLMAARAEQQRLQMQQMAQNGVDPRQNAAFNTQQGKVNYVSALAAARQQAVENELRNNDIDPRFAQNSVMQQTKPQASAIAASRRDETVRAQYEQNLNEWREKIQRAEGITKPKTRNEYDKWHEAQVARQQMIDYERRVAALKYPAISNLITLSDSEFAMRYDAAEKAYKQAVQNAQILRKDSSSSMDDLSSDANDIEAKATAEFVKWQNAARARDDAMGAFYNESVNTNMKLVPHAPTWASEKDHDGKNYTAAVQNHWDATQYARSHDTDGSKYMPLVNEWSFINGRTALNYTQTHAVSNFVNNAASGGKKTQQYNAFVANCAAAFYNQPEGLTKNEREKMEAMLTLANLMTDEERARFNTILRQGGGKEADKYFEYLYASVLPQRFDSYVNNEMEFQTRDGIGKVFESVISIPVNLAQGVSGVIHTLSTGQEDPIAAKLAATKYNLAQGARDAVGQGISSSITNALMNAGTAEDFAQWAGSAGNFLYGTGMSMADSATVAAISAGIGSAFQGAGLAAETASKIGSAIGGSLLGASAFNASYDEALQRGLSPDKARMTAIGNGFNEMLFETLSIGTLLEKTGKSVIKASKSAFVNWLVNTAVQAGVEGSEEVFTDIGNKIWDNRINGIFSEEMNKIREYVASGMSFNEAKEKVNREFAEQLGMSFLGGAISGGFMGGGAQVLNNFQMRGFERYGKGMDADAKAEVRNFDFKDEQMQELAKQDKLTNQDYGVLAAAMLQQRFEEGRAYVQNALKDGTITKEQKELYDKYAQMAKDGKLTAEVVASEEYAQDMDKLEPVFDIMDEGELIQQGMRDLAEAQRAVRDENAKYDKQVAAIENDTTLTDEQKQQKIDAIENERGEKVVEKVRDLEKLQKKYDENVKAENGKVETKRGNLTYDFSTSNKANTFDKMSDRQKSALRFAKLFADKYGMNIKVVDDTVAGESEDGHYNHDTDTITINISGANSVMYTVSHEVTHWLQEHNSKAYKTLKSAIEKELSRTDLIVSELPKSYQRVMGDYKTADNTVMDALVKYEQDMYKRQMNKALSKERAEDEVVARCCESFLKDRGFAQKMVAENPGAARTIAAKLRQLANDMKTLNEDALERGYDKYGELIDNSIEKAALEQIGDIEKIARMWENALNQAAKKAAKTKAPKAEVQHSFNNKLSDVDSPVVNRIADATFPIQPPTIKGADAMQKSVPSATKNALLDVQDSMFHPSQYSRNYAPQIQQRNAEYVMSKVNDDGTVKTDKQGNPLLRYPAWAYTRTGEKIVELAKRITKLYENQTDSHGNRLLPEETILSNNIFENASYLLDAEPTTECFRQTIYRAFLKQVTDKLGRPVTEREAIIVNQACIEIGIDAPCIYCYSLLDRKAKESYKLQYLAERDAFFKALDKEYGDDIERFRKDRAEGEQTKEIDKKTQEEHTVWTKPYMLYLSRITDPAAYKNGKYQKSMARDGNWSKADRVNLWLDVWENSYKNGSLVTAKDVRNIEADEESLKAAEGNELRTRELQDVIGWSQDASQAKVIVPYSAYTNEGSGNILSWSQDKIDKLNSEYGLRWYSHADFHPAFIVDNMQQILDASAKGLKGLMYLKPTEAAEIYAPTGMLINLSCFAQYKNGQYVVDDRLGADWETVQRLRKQYKNVGAVMVVTSDDMWMWAMTQDWVDVIIPLHLVRSGRDFVDAFGLQNYSKEQADALVGADAKKKYEAYIEAKAKEQDIELNSKNRKELEKANKSVYPSEHENDYTKYMEACKKRGLTPRFDRMRQIVEKGASYNGKKITLDDYMKCVNETRMPYTKAQPLQPKFNFAAAERAAAQLKQKGFFDYFKPSSEWNGKTMKVGDWVNQAYNDILAKKEPSKLGYGRDLAIDKNGKYIEVRSSEEARQRGVGGAHDNVQHSFNDKEYLALASKVKDGTATDADKAELRKQVDLAAERWGAITNDVDSNPETGEPEKSLYFYHGSVSDHTVFKKEMAGKNGSSQGKGFYFSTDEIFANRYAINEKGFGKMYKAFLKAENPIRSREHRISREERRQILLEMDRKEMDGRGYTYSVLEDIFPVTIDSDETYNHFVDEYMDFTEEWDDAQFYARLSTHMNIDAATSTMLEHGYDASIMEKRDKSQAIVVVFTPQQIKSADLVTYDSNGNIIPLSERFKTDRTGEDAWKNEDIRYSMNDKDFVLKKNNGEKWYELRDVKAHLFGSSVELDGGSLLNRVRMMQNLAEVYGSVTVDATSEKEAEAFKRAGAQREADTFGDSEYGTWVFEHQENKYEKDTQFDAKQKRNFADAVLKEIGTRKNFTKDQLLRFRAGLEKAFAALHNATFGDGDAMVAYEYVDKLFDRMLDAYTEMPEDASMLRDTILNALRRTTDGKGRIVRELDVTKTQMSEIRNAYENIADFNRALSKALGTRVFVKEVENATMLENLFTHSQDTRFDKTTNEGDMPSELMRLAQETVVDRVNKYKAESDERMAMKEALWDKATEIVGAEKTAAQKVREAVKQVRAEERAKAKTKTQEEVAKARLAERMHEGAIRAKERRASAERESNIKRDAAKREAKLKDVTKQKLEQQKLNTLRRDVKTIALKWNQRLVKMLANPTEASHIPVQLAREVAAFTDALTRYLDSGTQRGQINLEKIAKAYQQAFDDQETIAQAKAENRKYDPRGAVLDREMFDEQLVGMINELNTILQGKTLKDLDAFEMRMLLNTVRGVAHTVYEANRMIGTTERKAIWQVGDTMVKELESAPKIKGGFARFFLEESLDLRRIAKVFSGSNENAEFVKLSDMLNRGAIEKERVAQVLSGMFDPLTQQYGDEIRKWYGKNAEWIDTGITKNGRKVEITKGMRVSLAMHVLNAGNMRHIENGGVTIPNRELYAKGKLADAYANGTLVRLNSDQINTIISQMTEAEKAYVEVAKEFFHQRTGYYVNKTSLQLLGYRKATVENYFPIHTDRNYTKSDFASVVRDGSIEGQGFLKERVMASNPVYLEDITSVVNRQIKGVSLYAGLAVPMRNFNAVMNASVYEDENGNWVPRTTVRKAMTQSMGEYGAKIVQGFLQDVSGMSAVDVTPGEQRVAKLQTRYVKAVLLANLKVTLKQAASYPTAAAVIPWKYLSKALLKGGRNQRLISRADVDLINQYTPLYKMRRDGMANEITSIMAERGLEQKMPWLLGWITKMDVATVGRLWSAAEYMVADQQNLPVGSDEYYKAVAEVFNQTIQQTQPNFTPLQRNAALRSKNPVIRTLTLFGTQRMQNGGILIESAMELKHAKTDAQKQAARVKFGRAVASQIVQNLMLIAIGFAVDALRGRMTGWRDEDKELNAKSIFGNVLDQFMGNIFGSFLGGSEAYAQTIGKWMRKAMNLPTHKTKFTVPALASLEEILDFANDVEGLPDYLMNHDASENKTKLLSFTKKLAKVGGYVTGFPFENMTKDLIDGLNPALQDIIDASNTGELIPWLHNSGKLDSAKTAANYKEWTKAGFSGRDYFYWTEKLNAVKGGRDGRIPVLLESDLTNEQKALMMQLLDTSDGYAKGTVFYNKKGEQYIDFAAPTEKQQALPMPSAEPSAEQTATPAAEPTATPNPLSEAKQEGVRQAVAKGVDEKTANEAFLHYQDLYGTEGRDEEFRSWLFENVKSPENRAVLEYHVLGRASSVEGAVTYRQDGSVYRDYTNESWYTLSTNKSKRYEAGKRLEKTGLSVEKTVEIYNGLADYTKKAEWKEYLKKQGLTDEQITIFLWSRGWAKMG